MRVTAALVRMPPAGGRAAWTGLAWLGSYTIAAHFTTLDEFKHWLLPRKGAPLVCTQGHPIGYSTQGHPIGYSAQRVPNRVLNPRVPNRVLSPTGTQ